MLDPLSDILTRLRLQGTLYFRTAFSAPWGEGVPSYRNVARFHYADRGDCKVRIASSGTVVDVRQGDLIIIPHGAAHDLLSAGDTHRIIPPLETVLEQSGYTGQGVLVYGGTDTSRTTQLICGHFSMAERASHMLFDKLSDHILIPNYGESAGRWMETSLRMIASETGQDRIGGDLIAQKISEVIFAQALRAFIETDAAAQLGLAGFADPRIFRALDAFHRDPGRTWSVGSLAQVAGQSRTGFAVHFADKMGMTPMQYLTSWRMQIAQQGLLNSDRPITDIALDVGYASDSAFARVFKREVGQSPAAFRKAHSRKPALSDP